MFATNALADGKPFISVEKTEYNLGKVALCVRRIEVDLPITNYGDAPLNISEILTDCTCTVVEFDNSTPILPDQSRMAKVIFEIPNFVSGDFDKEIWIHSDSEKSELSIKYHLVLTNEIE